MSPGAIFCLRVFAAGFAIAAGAAVMLALALPAGLASLQATL
jgi:hypothetical protein